MHLDRTYIGDGVYATFDGWHVWLTTERDDRIHTIALEPAVIEALNRYAAEVLKRRFAEPPASPPD